MNQMYNKMKQFDDAVILIYQRESTENQGVHCVSKLPSAWSYKLYFHTQVLFASG